MLSDVQNPHLRIVRLRWGCTVKLEQDKKNQTYILLTDSSHHKGDKKTSAFVLKCIIIT